VSRPLVDRLVRIGSAALLLTLVVVGLGTSALLYARARAALDASLLAAAHAYGGDEEAWEVELGHPAIDLRVARRGDREIPPQWLDDVWARERAAWHDLGGDRVLLAPIEAEDDEDEAEDHAVLVARARAVTLATLGPFAFAYGLVSAVVVLAATLAWRRLARAAVGPLLRARDEVAQVVGAGSGARVAVDGPPEVSDLLRAVNALLGRLDHAFLAQARFTAEAAHELRTPIAAVLGEIEVARRRPRGAEEYREVLDAVHGDVARLAALVEGLLALARVDAGQAERGREPLRASALASTAAAQEQAGIEAAGGRLAVHILGDPLVIAQPALAVVALANLLRNAAVHAPGVSVRLGVDSDGELARFVVEDEGPGIPADQREAVFTRLARVARRSPGLGVGLPLAREIARRHGGDCRVEPAAAGTRVVFTLPVSRGEPQPPAPGPSAA
jgi:two-component system OmpR family sensor kinase